MRDVYGVNRGLITRKTSIVKYGSSQSFGINPNFDLNTLPKSMRNYIIKEKSLNGMFPFTPTGSIRMSSFSQKLKAIQLGSRFNIDYVEKFVKKTNIEVTLTSDPTVKNTIDLFEKGKLTSLPTHIKLISLAKKIQNHDKNVKVALHSVDNAIVVELPIFDPKTQKLTGHIDLLVWEEDGYLVVWDYKPQWKTVKWSPKPNTAVSSNFIQFVPQVASYALTLMHQLGLKGVKCGIYNSEGAWVFDPVVVMNTLNSDFPTANFPWRSYHFLNI